MKDREDALSAALGRTASHTSTGAGAALGVAADLLQVLGRIVVKRATEATWSMITTRLKEALGCELKGINSKQAKAAWKQAKEKWRKAQITHGQARGSFKQAREAWRQAKQEYRKQRAAARKARRAKYKNAKATWRKAKMEHRRAKRKWKKAKRSFTRARFKWTNSKIKYVNLCRVLSSARIKTIFKQPRILLDATLADFSELFFAKLNELASSRKKPWANELATQLEQFQLKDLIRDMLLEVAKTGSLKSAAAKAKHHFMVRLKQIGVFNTTCPKKSSTLKGWSLTVTRAIWAAADCIIRAQSNPHLQNSMVQQLVKHCPLVQRLMTCRPADANEALSAGVLADRVVSLKKAIKERKLKTVPTILGRIVAAAKSYVDEARKARQLPVGPLFVFGKQLSKLVTFIHAQAAELKKNLGAKRAKCQEQRLCRKGKGVLNAAITDAESRLKEYAKAVGSFQGLISQATALLGVDNKVAAQVAKMAGYAMQVLAIISTHKGEKLAQAVVKLFLGAMRDGLNKHPTAQAVLQGVEGVFNAVLERDWPKAVTSLLPVLEHLLEKKESARFRKALSLLVAVANYALTYQKKEKMTQEELQKMRQEIIEELIDSLTDRSERKGWVVSLGGALGLGGALRYTLTDSKLDRKNLGFQGPFSLPIGIALQYYGAPDHKAWRKRSMGAHFMLGFVDIGQYVSFGGEQDWQVERPDPVSSVSFSVHAGFWFGNRTSVTG